jgi:very-short-patch-repair endonuclease
MWVKMSDAEHLLARELKRLGVPFKQQVPIAGYIVDFVIGDMLVIEVEGLQHHANPEKQRRLFIPYLIFVDGNIK